MASTKRIFTVILALIAWFGLGTQFYLILQTSDDFGFTTLRTISNYFSYFTILSNQLVAITLTAVLINRRSIFHGINFQSAVALYIFLVGLVYNLVLRAVWDPTGLQLIADNILHVVVPLLYLIWWAIYTPKQYLQWNDLLLWLIFPAAYLIYSLVRGLITGFYPYPFLHATQLGYTKVAINSLFVLLAFVVAGLGLIAFNKIGKRS